MHDNCMTDLENPALKCSDSMHVICFYSCRTLTNMTKQIRVGGEGDNFNQLCKLVVFQLSIEACTVWYL